MYNTSNAALLPFFRPGDSTIKCGEGDNVRDDMKTAGNRQKVSPRVKAGEGTHPFMWLPADAVWTGNCSRHSATQGPSTTCGPQVAGDHQLQVGGVVFYLSSRVTQRVTVQVVHRMKPRPSRVKSRLTKRGKHREERTGAETETERRVGTKRTGKFSSFYAPEKGGKEGFRK